MGNTSSQLVPADQSQPEEGDDHNDDDKSAATIGALRAPRDKVGSAGTAHFSPLPPREQLVRGTKRKAQRDTFANGLTPPATFEKIDSEEGADIGFEEEEGDIDDGASHPSLDQDSLSEVEADLSAELSEHDQVHDYSNAPNDDHDFSLTNDGPIASIADLVRPPSPRVVILRSPLRSSAQYKRTRSMSFDSASPSLVSSGTLSTVAGKKLTAAERKERLDRKRLRAEARARKESRSLQRITAAKKRGQAEGRDAEGEERTNGLSPPIELSQSPAFRAAKKRGREEEGGSPAKRQRKSNGGAFTAINGERDVDASPLSSDALGDSPVAAPATAKGKGPARGGEKSAKATPATAKGKAPMKATASTKAKAQRRMTDFSIETGRLGAMMSSPMKGPSPREKTGVFSKEEIARLDAAVELYGTINDIPMERIVAWYQTGANERSRKTAITKFVAEQLGDRCRKSVRQFMNRHLCLATRGPWKPEEDKRLRELFEEKPKNWTYIAGKMDRMPEDCRDRWRDNTGVTERSMGLWKPDETALFLSIIDRKVAELKETTYKDREDMDDIDIEEQLNWGEVSVEMEAKRSRLQCREKWVKLRRKEQKLAGVPSELIRPKAPNKGHKSVKKGEKPSMRKLKAERANARKVQGKEGDVVADEEEGTPSKAAPTTTTTTGKRLNAAQRLNGKFKSAERVVEESGSESESDSGSESDDESEPEDNENVTTANNVAALVDDEAEEDDESDTSSVDAYFPGVDAAKAAPTSKSTSASGSTSDSDLTSASEDEDVPMPDAEEIEESDSEAIPAPAPAAAAEVSASDSESESESESEPNDVQGLRTPDSSSIVSSSPEAQVVQDSQPAPPLGRGSLMSPELGSPGKPVAAAAAAKGRSAAAVKGQGKAGMLKHPSLIKGGEVEDIEETGSESEDESGSEDGSEDGSESESDSEEGEEEEQGETSRSGSESEEDSDSSSESEAEPASSDTGETAPRKTGGNVAPATTASKAVSDSGSGSSAEESTSASGSGSESGGEDGEEVEESASEDEDEESEEETDSE